MTTTVTPADDASRGIDGLRLADALRAGIYRLFEQTDHLNEINVFPVPDDDTGTNLSMTLSVVLAALDREPLPHVGALLVRIADAALDSARGNSGAMTACRPHAQKQERRLAAASSSVRSGSFCLLAAPTRHSQTCQPETKQRQRRRLRHRGRGATIDPVVAERPGRVVTETGASRGAGVRHRHVVVAVLPDGVIAVVQREVLRCRGNRRDRAAAEVVVLRNHRRRIREIQ